jgi:hypothetical protein
MLKDSFQTEKSYEKNIQSQINKKRGGVEMGYRGTGSQRFSSSAATLPHFLQMNLGFLTSSLIWSRVTLPLSAI